MNMIDLDSTEKVIIIM